MLRVKTLGVIVALLAAGGLQAQRSTSASPTLTGVDYAEIQRLYYQYAWGFDSCAEKGQAFARVFTPDGTFVLPGGKVIQGRDKLAEFAKCPDGMTIRPTQHWIGNVLIMPSPEGATASAYVMQVNSAEHALLATDLAVRRPGSARNRLVSVRPRSGLSNACTWREAATMPSFS